MIKAILSLLTQFALVSKESQTYQLFYLVADGVFYYMPFFLAFSAGKKFKCNPYLSLIFAAMLVHPNYIALKTAGEAVKLFGFLPVTMASYTSSVVPIILIVYFQSIVEKFFSKITPKAIKVFFVPMITILITVPVGYVVLGPLGSIVGTYLAKGFTALDAYAGWLVPMLVGGLCPLLVLTGSTMLWAAHRLSACNHGLCNDPGSRHGLQQYGSVGRYVWCGAQEQKRRDQDACFYGWHHCTVRHY